VSLMPCPDCGRQISYSAIACIHCGRPMQDVGDRLTGAGRPLDPNPALADALITPRCVKCGGTDLRSLRVLHQMGLTAVQTNTTGGGVGMTSIAGQGGLGIGIFKAQTRGTQVTALSEAVAPPVRRTYDKEQEKKAARPATALAVGAAAAGLFVFSGVNQLLSYAVFWGALVTGLILRSALQRKYRESIDHWNQAEYQALLRNWEASAMCMTCGERQRTTIA
jgi:hypothetical protein